MELKVVPKLIATANCAALKSVSWNHSHDMLRALFAIFLTLNALAAASPEEAAPMGRRIMFDREAGFTVSYPYAWNAPDQYKTQVNDGHESGLDMNRRLKEMIINGRKVMVLEEVKDKFELSALRAFSATSSSSITAVELELWGNKQASAKLTWKPFDYYQRLKDRPHGDPKWAMEGIITLVGENKDRCAIVAAYGMNNLKLAGIVMAGKATADANVKIIDAFEIMSSVTKPTLAEMTAGKIGKLMSWKEHKARQGYVINRYGQPFRADTNSPVNWSDAWEIETEHYRILGNAGAARLMQHAVYYEALYRSYTNFFLPDRMPPYKAEVHCFNTVDQFENGARAWVDPTFQARTYGGIIGGFFVPRRLSLYVYEESAKVAGNPKFSIEKVSAHECAHQFLHMTCNGSDNIPTWINEGLAVLFESGYVDGNTFLLVPPSDRISSLRSSYSRFKDTLMPLDQYIDHHGHIQASQYGEVYAMTHFWIYGNGNAGFERMRSFLKALKAGQDGAKAFEDIFMTDIIKAQGSRENAIKAWKTALLDHVNSNRVSNLIPPPPPPPKKP